jgi:hypothetical protein
MTDKGRLVARQLGKPVTTRQQRVRSEKYAFELSLKFKTSQFCEFLLPGNFVQAQIQRTSMLNWQSLCNVYFLLNQFVATRNAKI